MRTYARVACGLLGLIAVSTGPSFASERFTVSQDRLTVQDSLTGLTWQRFVPYAGFKWGEAIEHCDSLRWGSAELPWRLPSLRELFSLVDVEEQQSPRIDAVSFPETPSAFFWTSSYMDGRVAGVFFDMSDFPTGVGGDDSLGHCRCVTGRMSADYEVPDDAWANWITIPLETVVKPR